MSVTGPYDVGDRIRMGNHSTTADTNAFTNSSGAATDPTDVTLRLKKPDGRITTYRWPTPGAGESALSKESTGRFFADVTLDTPRVWSWELAGTGAVVAMDQGELFVRVSVV